MENVKFGFEIAFYAISAVAAIFALFTYRRSSATRRAEWLVTLYQKFFEDALYKEMRWVLDNRVEPEYSKLRKCVEQHLRPVR